MPIEVSESESVKNRCWFLLAWYLYYLLWYKLVVHHREVTMKNDDEEDPCLRCLRFVLAVHIMVRMMSP